MKFKSGDRVVCVTSSEDNHFTENEVYIIKKVNGNHVILDDNRGMPNGWSTEYFELAQPWLNEQKLKKVLGL